MKVKYWTLIILYFISTVCHAQHEKIYKLDKKKELTIGSTCLILGIADAILSDRSSALTDEEILSLSIDDIPSIDRSATRQNSIKAKDLSDIFEYSVFFMPAPLFISERIRGEAKEIGVMYIEAFSFNLLSNQFVKFITKRNRPFMYNESIDIAAKRTTNGRKSFYSGHVSHTATLSIFTAKVFADIYPESKWRPLVWTGAFAIPITTGYLRYKAGRHFLSDVTAGVIAGSLIGYFIPEWHRRKDILPKGVSLEPDNNGLSLRYIF